MGPFDLPPSTPPVSFQPPEPHRPARRSSGRTAAVLAASVALVGAGVLAIALFAWHDDSPAANAAQEDGTTPPTPAPETAPPTAAPQTAPATTAPAGDLSGKIVIQIGDGDPIVIDLNDLGALGGSGGLGDLGNIEQCIGDLPFNIDLNAAPGDAGLPSFDVFGNGDTVTVTGPNGVSLLTFGDGDGSITITKKDGEISISSDGDVQQSDLGAPDASLPIPSLPDLPDFGQITKCLEDATGNGG
jgi:hypothetical protein